MPAKKTSIETFVDCAKEVYISLSTEEKENIEYAHFIKKAIEIYYNDKCDYSRLKTGYKYLKRYYETHPITIKNSRAKRTGDNLTYKDIKDLLDNDTKKDQILKALDEEYRYYWFEQKVINDREKQENKIFLVIECNPETTDNVYNVIANCYTDLIDSMYYGFGGLLLVFSSDESFKTFISHIKKDNTQK